jgi:transposase IS66-like protein
MMIGYDTSEVLDREPAKWFVRVTKREKRACGKCSAVQMAELARRASWTRDWPATAW